MEKGGGYIFFFWKAYPAGERRHHAIKVDLYDKLTADPVASNEQLMTLRSPLVRDQFCTIVSAYAPTLNTSDDQKDRFYHQTS